MPVYRAEHRCPKKGFDAFRFFHARTDAVSADCPGCGKNVPVAIEVKEESK